MVIANPMAITKRANPRLRQSLRVVRCTITAEQRPRGHDRTPAATPPAPVAINVKVATAIDEASKHHLQTRSSRGYRSLPMAASMAKFMMPIPAAEVPAIHGHEQLKTRKRRRLPRCSIRARCLPIFFPVRCLPNANNSVAPQQQPGQHPQKTCLPAS